ncbi:cytochrome-c peroxidase [Arenibaculum sp.]|jgi:cytochrome c peroxidase|uniref:cytochrome-c peroxidase n=1 Tax=Arenibaculum sp. TaxID=2865862 RepID=UPI002E0E4593|nr:cytochrome-c peroxidase [Arenibaculum sp.]
MLGLTHGLAALLALAGLALALDGAVARSDRPISEEEWRLIRPLALDQLPAPPADPSNRVVEDPRAAVLGEALFFDARFSSSGTISCATCHVPEKGFQDGLRLGQGIGTTDRRTMPVAGIAHSPWLFWDGRKDSLWAQALGPLESAVEHGGDRTRYAHLVAAHYRESYETLFGALPALDHLPAAAGPVEEPAARAAWDSMTAKDRETVTHVFVNLGKAIAAYERRIGFGPSRFDRWVSAFSGDPAEAAGLLSADEFQGLKVFVGKGQCINCHNGPLFTDNHFHNTGVPPVAGMPADRGRAVGALHVREDPFNCLGPYSDAAPTDCAELRFMASTGEDMERAFKPPALRGGRRAAALHARRTVRHPARGPRPL